MAWEPGSPEYQSWAAANAAKTGATAPGFDQWGMPIGSRSIADSGGYRLIDDPATATTPPAGMTDSQLSAKAIIQGALDQYGLGSLGDRLWGDYLGGAPMEQVFLNLRQAPEYKVRFSGMDALAKKGRAISESQYIDLERTYAQMFKTYGLPASFYDGPDDYARLIGGEVAPTEIRDRLQMASIAANSAPQEVRDELARNYGLDAGAITAYYLDPDKALPVLQTQFASAQIGAASTRTGYGQLSRTEAERLAALGMSEDAATKGFGELARSKELFGALDAGEEAIGRSDQLGVLEGNAAAIERLNRRAQRRKAAFEGGGGFAAGREGVSGLGSASS